MGVLALVGTRKGLFLLRARDRRHSWQAEGPLLEGWGVFHAIVDERDGTIFAATNHLVYGPTVQRSTTAARPGGGRSRSACQRNRADCERHLACRAGRPQEPGTLYLGGDPAFLFRSDDGGETWEVNRGILEHPTRDRWPPGAEASAAIRSSSTPADPQRMYVAMSRRGHFAQ